MENKKGKIGEGETMERNRKYELRKRGESGTIAGAFNPELSGIELGKNRAFSAFSSLFFTSFIAVGLRAL